jgi:hypothetical protein
VIVAFVAVCPDVDFFVVGDLRGLERPPFKGMVGWGSKIADGEGILMSSMPNQNRSDDMGPVRSVTEYRRATGNAKKGRCELYKQ